MFVNHSTIARWENGTRLPDAAMIMRLANCLQVDINTLLHVVAQSDDHTNIIMVDDNVANGVRTRCLPSGRFLVLKIRDVIFITTVYGW